MAKVDEAGALQEGTLRAACAAEREALMGYVPGFTRPLLGRAARKRPDSWLEDCSRSASVGNSFHTLSTSVLLGLMLESAGFEGIMSFPVELQRGFFAELEALRHEGRERGYEQALAGELVIKNPRPALEAGSMALALAETEEALELDAVLPMAQSSASQRPVPPRWREGP